MDNTPNYKEYGIGDLFSAYKSVDKEKYPDIFAKIKNEFDRRKLNPEEVGYQDLKYLKKQETLKKYKIRKTNLKLELEGLITTENPSEYKIEELINQLNFTINSYLKISTNKFSYIIARRDFLGYRLEHRDNSHILLFVSDSISKSSAIEIMECYFFEDSNWQKKIEWNEYNVEYKDEEKGSLISKNKMLIFLVIFLLIEVFRVDNVIWDTGLKYLKEHNIKSLYFLSFISMVIVLFNNKKYKYVRRLNSFDRMNLYSILIFAIISMILSLLSVFHLINI